MNSHSIPYMNVPFHYPSLEGLSLLLLSRGFLNSTHGPPPHIKNLRVEIHEIEKRSENGLALTFKTLLELEIAIWGSSCSSVLKGSRQNGEVLFRSQEGTKAKTEQIPFKEQTKSLKTKSHCSQVYLKPLAKSFSLWAKVRADEVSLLGRAICRVEDVFCIHLREAQWNRTYYKQNRTPRRTQ